MIYWLSTHTHTHTHTHTPTHTHTHMHTCTHAHTNARTHTYTHTHTHTNTCTPMHTHTHTHACMHTLTKQACTRTHTHTNTDHDTYHTPPNRYSHEDQKPLKSHTHLQQSCDNWLSVWDVSPFLFGIPYSTKDIHHSLSAVDTHKKTYQSQHTDSAGVWVHILCTDLNIQALVCNIVWN